MPARRRPTCGTRAAGCWPRTAPRRARRSRSPLHRPVEHALGQPGGLLVGERAEEPGLGELGHERRVEAHQVDRAVLGRQPPDELLPLAGGVGGQHRDLDAVGAVGGLGALLGQLSCPPLSGLMYQVSVGGPRRRRHRRPARRRPPRPPAPRPPEVPRRAACGRGSVSTAWSSCPEPPARVRATPGNGPLLRSSPRARESRTTASVTVRSVTRPVVTRPRRRSACSRRPAGGSLAGRRGASPTTARCSLPVHAVHRRRSRAPPSCSVDQHVVDGQEPGRRPA